MRMYSVHRSSVSKFMSGRSASLRRSSSSYNSYKLGGNTTFQQYLQEAKRLTSDIEESENTAPAENESAKKTTTLSKYARTQESTYSKNSSSKFNTGTDIMSESSDELTKLLAKESPDMEKAYSEAAKFIEGYNEMTASVRSSSNGSVARKSDFINSITKVYARSLEKVGVKADTKGVLTIDKEKFMNASMKDIGNIFSSKGSFASHIAEQTDSIKKLSQFSASTYSDSSSRLSYTSSMSGSKFNWKL